MWGHRLRLRFLRATRRYHYHLLTGALLIGLIAAWVFLVPSSDRFLTEFYVLGKAGLTEDYPREAAVGDELAVTMGVVNRERDARTFRVEVWVVDSWNPKRRALVAQDSAITLSPSQSREEPISWRMPWAGDDQHVRFLLFTGDDSQPYRQVSLWINVTE
jgi:uncharacterized membrane protein